MKNDKDELKNLLDQLQNDISEDAQKEQKKKSFRNKILIIIGVIIAVLCVGYALGKRSNNQEPKADHSITESISQTSNNTNYSLGEQSTDKNSSNDDGKLKKKTEYSSSEIMTYRQGYVTGDDVFVRSAPSTDSDPICLVNKGTGVEILNTRQHNDDGETYYVMRVNSYEAIDIDTDQKIMLNKGLALRFLDYGNNKDQAVCMIKTGDIDRRVWLRYGFRPGSSCVVERMSNNDWYNVRLVLEYK